ncbi:hypothetical protein [Neobacillus sp. 19]|uniref:hypothetical protein n=1 Tax=Neobacillus sp. 19 TaxID=3394458 RepID=UPI003C2B8BD1
MSHLSDKELLQLLSDFPKYELTTVQRTEMLKKMTEIGNQREEANDSFSKNRCPCRGTGVHSNCPYPLFYKHRGTITKDWIHEYCNTGSRLFCLKG